MPIFTGLAGYWFRLPNSLMTIQEANNLLQKEATQTQLLDCLKSLCKEYGYIEGMINAELWDLASGGKVLSEIQILIEQLEQKIKCTD